MSNLLAVYEAKRASSLSNPTSASVFVQADASTRAAFVKIPFNALNNPASLNGRVVAFGRATTGTTSNFKATVQYTSDVTSTTCATAASNTDFFALTNRSYVTLTRPWRIALDIVWDSTSARLSGQSNGFNAETIETANASITALTAIDLTTDKCGFVVSALFGTSNASNVAYLDDFYCEVSR